MTNVLPAFSSFRRLTDEQRALIGGRGADTRPLASWRQLLEGIARFERKRESTRARLRVILVLLLVASGGLLSVSQAAGTSLPVGRDALLWGGVVGLALTAWAAKRAYWLARAAVAPELARTVLPFLRTLEKEGDPRAALYLSLRLDGAVPAGAEEVRWLQSALALPDGTLLHVSGHDVERPSGTATVLTAIRSRPVSSLEEHVLGADDPSASGLTRRVAAEAQAEGNPFTSGEMLALREAHGVKVEMLRLESFAEQRVPPPPVGEVLEEASVEIPGGRRDPAVTSARLEELSRQARGRR